MLESARHCLMHGVIVTSFDKIGSPSVAKEESLKLLVTDTGQNVRVINLVAI